MNTTVPFDAIPNNDHQSDDVTNIELTVLIPCLNESETIATCINKAQQYFAQYQVAGEVLVADNGSVDESVLIATDSGARVIHVPEKGYGAALISGIKNAYGNYIIMGDADDSYDFTDLNGFLNRLRADDDMVIGNRFKGGIEQGAMPFLHRYVGNPVLTKIGQIFFHSDIGDFHCGLRGFNRNRVQALDLKCTGMEFASEMIVKASLANYTLTEVPTTLSKDGRSGSPHLRSWRDGWRHLVFLLLLAPRWLFFYPGLCLLGLGALLMVLLVDGPVDIGNITFDVNTLAFSAAFIVCGHQAVLFSILSLVLASDMGVRTESDLVTRLRGLFTVENAIIVGAILVLSGLYAGGRAVGLWQGTGFGALDPTDSLRIVIPAVTALILGLQIIFSGFFMGLLQLMKFKR